MTTIKVTMETRDRLKSQADAAGLTLGAHLTRLARLADRERRWTELRATIERMTTADWADYEAETGAWDATLDDESAEEWTEADLVDGR